MQYIPFYVECCTENKIAKIGLVITILSLQEVLKPVATKGQLISKGKFSVFNSLKKTNLKILIFALAYWGSFFGRIEKNQKARSKLTDLYKYLVATQIWRGRTEDKKANPAPPIDTWETWLRQNQTL